MNVLMLRSCSATVLFGPIPHANEMLACNVSARADGLSGGGEANAGRSGSAGGAERREVATVKSGPPQLAVVVILKRANSQRARSQGGKRFDRGAGSRDRR